MAPFLVPLAVMAAWVPRVVAGVESDSNLIRWEEGGLDGGGRSTGGAPRILKREGKEGQGEETIILREGIVFQTEGCPQLISADEALARSEDDSIPGNVITLLSEGKGRAGNHFLVVSAYLAMAYCCKSKVLNMPQHDDTFPSAAEDGSFDSDQRFFDFSGVGTMPLEEYEGMSEDPQVCEPQFEQGGGEAFHLAFVHPRLLSCMNRVYLRGCEAKYLEPLLGTEDFCAKPPASSRRHLQDNVAAEKEDAARTLPVALSSPSVRGSPSPTRFASSEESGRSSAAPWAQSHDHHASQASGPIKNNSDIHPELSPRRADHQAVLDSRRRLGGGSSDGNGGPYLGVTGQAIGGGGKYDSGRGGKEGSAGSLVIHIRSGDIFMPLNADRMKVDFLGFGQPPLQFYLRVIASQPWSDVTILTFCPRPVGLNPAFAALEMMQRTGLLGPNVAIHKDRDLLTDIQSMLCADGLAISRSSLHFLTVAHTRAKHYFVPSECGPGTYTRKTRRRRDGTKKPNPNNTTLLCTEKPEAEVYGVEWEVDEDAYALYNSWQATDAQLLDMLLFDGIKGLTHCCPR